MNTLDRSRTGLIMGLGLHGGGLASLKYVLPQLKEIIVTDLRPVEKLGPALQKLHAICANTEGAASVKLRLGAHNEEDFAAADIIIKNPAVPLSSPYLKALREDCIKATDLSLFLEKNTRPLIVVSGSKGKSTTASWIAHMLRNAGYPEADLAGNIGVSPLELLDKEGTTKDPIVLELSSWQLRDLRWCGVSLSGHIAVLTSIYPDHLNTYNSFEEYVEDKRYIIDNAKIYVYPRKNPWIDPREHEGCLEHLDEQTLLVGCKPKEDIKTHLKGQHYAIALSMVYAIGKLLKIRERKLKRAISSFQGIRHRMERFEIGAYSFINDSAATIPQATVADLIAHSGCVLLTGGTDKELDFEGLYSHYRHAKRIYLLRGTATERLRVGLEKEGIKYEGVYDSLAHALDAIHQDLQEGETLLFAPGATSFELFLHEFDRGDQFIAGVRERWQA